MSFEKLPNFLVNFFKADMSGRDTPSYRFDSFLLDVAEQQLFRDEKVVPLTPKAFDVLVYLVAHGGHLVLKDDLMHAVWPDSFVDEVNLPRTIHTLRRALGEDENGRKLIETVPTKGYRFVADVTEICDTPHQQSAVAIGGLDNVIELPSANRVLPTADKPKQKARIILFTVGFLTAVALVALLSFNFRSTGSGVVRKIAVLPLKPIDASTRDVTYEIGIADSLINRLGSMKGIVVRPLSATRKYSDIDQDAFSAGREQQVDYVMAANYQLANDKIRVTAQLFNVESGQIEVTEIIEKPAGEIFAVQDAISGEVGKMLLARFAVTDGSPLSKRGTTNEDAYRLYLQGAALADKRTQEEVRKAVEYFEQAVKLDPNYALAYARLADAQAAMALNLGADTQEQYPKAKTAIEKALAIDDNLAEAHSYLGEIKSDFEGDLAGAEREHRKAIALDPNSSIAHRMYAILLIYLGRHDESIAESKTAIDLEPASVLNHLIFGRTLLFARRYDEAIAELERTSETDPEYFFALQSLSVTYHFKGDDDRAFEYFIKKLVVAGDEPDEINSWKTIYAKSGWRGILERQLEEAQADEKNGKPHYIHLANVSSELGQVDQAFAYLEKALVQDGTINMLKVHPRYDPLRSDPRFDDLLRRVGLK